MRTRSSFNLPVESSPNPSTSNPERRNRRRSKQPFILEESPVDTMADQRTMAELLRAPTEDYAEAIVVPSILAEQFELKHSFINMMTSDQFFGLEKDNPHDHIRCDTNSSSSEIDKLTHAVNQQTSAVTTAMIAILKQFQATSPPASVKAIEEIYVTCGGAHPYYQCLAADGNTFSKLRDNIQGYVAAAAVNYNQGSLPSNTIANQKGELKAITTRSGIVLDGPFVPIPPPFINPEEDERVEETLTDQDLVNGYPQKLPEKLGDPGKFLILCGFSELKCKALADLGASINLMPLSVWKKLGLPELISTRMTLELANRAICTPAGIARDVFVSVGKFTFLVDFVIVDYESDPRVPFILGRPFLRTARAFIDVHTEEMILHDGDERLTLNMRHGTSSYSNQPQKESINMINIYDDSSEDFLKELFTINHQSGNLTFSSHLKLTSQEVKDDVFDPEGGNIKPDQGKLTSVVMKDNLAEPRLHVPNVLTTHPTLMLDLDFFPSDNSLPEYEIFCFDIEEKNSGSTTIHADISLLDLECFIFNGKPDPGELTSIVDSEIRENVLFATNVNLPPEEDHSPLFDYVIWIFLSFLTYLVVPLNLLSSGNEDTDPGISNYHFPSLLPDVSHRCETFMKFNVYPKLLNESSMEILSFTCSPIEQ
uniref:Reverse transcriptase domain-containing protein n=1 Tax=Tanacetum cinerariifolium TaxID=118510 RepID=A0A6L2NG01_TANCI|nr:reverse transcriptase domain-containing protein [Tanacetum cinerariifolium]